MPFSFDSGWADYHLNRRQSLEPERPKNGCKQDAQARASLSQWNEASDVYLSGHMDTACSLLILNECADKSIFDVREYHKKAG